MSIHNSAQARENILRKLRTGLERASLPKPFPEIDQQPLAGAFGGQDIPMDEAFATEFIKLGGKFVFCTNELELLDGMLSLYDREDWQQLLCSSPRLLQLFHNNKMSFIKMADARDSGADACITDCEFLVARTGSVILSSRQHLGRMSSIYFPVHIVVAYASQLVPDIGAGIKAMQDRYGAELPSMINLNTGASRTADIEKTLVVGVHGPREVYCFFVNK
jgi:L-lactate dehydrogenase complex protein LldG